MDVLLRLRVLIWVLVISLWGVMVYQYLGEDEKESAAMHPIVNPYPNPDAAPPAPRRSPRRDAGGRGPGAGRGRREPRRGRAGVSRSHRSG
jgi:hypothetical protein